MNRHQFVGTAALCVLVGGMVLAAPVMAQESDSPVVTASPGKMALIKENVVIALTGGISGQQADAAQLVRDLRYLRPEQSYEGYVVPLMAILKDENADRGARILSALALDELGSSRGDFAIARTAQFTSDPHVRYVCSSLVMSHGVNQKSARPGITSFRALEEIRY